MKSDLVIYLLVCLFIIMHNLISGNQICSKLEFVQGSEKIVALEGSPVNLTFYLDTKQCSSNQTRYTIKVSRDNNGRHVDICKFILDNTCMVSVHSVGCSCLAPHGPMLFSKNVTSDDNNTVYIWKWGDFSPREDRRVTFKTINHWFLLNGVHNRTVRVSEDTTVDMLCQSDTWTSTRIIREVDGDRLLASRPSDGMQSGQLRYIINKTRCEDTGDYRCEFNYTAGLFYTETVRLLVPCAPRQQRDERHSPFVVSNGHLSLNMTAYPTPHVKIYYKLNSIEAVKNRMQTTCAADNMKFASIICNISVINVTKADDEAQFVVVFSNDLGELPFTFRIRLNGTTEKLVLMWGQHDHVTTSPQRQ